MYSKGSFPVSCRSIINRELLKTAEDYVRVMLEQSAQTDEQAKLRQLLELVKTGHWQATGKM